MTDREHDVRVEMDRQIFRIHHSLAHGVPQVAKHYPHLRVLGGSPGRLKIRPDFAGHTGPRAVFSPKSSSRSASWLLRRQPDYLVERICVDDGQEERHGLRAGILARGHRQHSSVHQRESFSMPQGDCQLDL